MYLIPFFHFLVVGFAFIGALSASLYVRGVIKPSDAVAIEGIARMLTLPPQCSQADLIPIRDYHVTMKPIKYDRTQKEAVLNPDEDTLWLIQKNLCQYVTTFQTVRWRIKGYSGDFGKHGAFEIVREFETSGRFGDFMIAKPHVSILRSKPHNQKTKACKTLAKAPTPLPAITFLIDEFCADARKGKPLACMNKASCLALPPLPPSQRHQ